VLPPIKKIYCSGIKIIPCELLGHKREVECKEISLVERFIDQKRECGSFVDGVMPPDIYNIL
jgi:hypothetical protein